MSFVTRIVWVFLGILTLPAWLQAAPHAAHTRLMLAGGDNVHDDDVHPAEAFEQFCQWGGGKDAVILDVLWATGFPEETYKGVVHAFAACGAQVEKTVFGPRDALWRKTVFEQIHRATAIFFSGGDQSRIMDVLMEDPELLHELRRLYREEHIPFGGTSAGTAVMSLIMLTGNGTPGSQDSEGGFKVIDGKTVETREGLGLIPGVIMDSHYIKRQRENRLFGLVLDHPDLLGIGVDERSVMMVTDDVHAEVPEGSTVMTVAARKDDGHLDVHVIRGPKTFDLHALMKKR